MLKNEIFRDIFRLHKIKESFRFAIEGIIYLFLYHRNMRIIFLAGIGAFFLGLYFKLRGIELAALCITITLVFMAEIFNTAIEGLMDVLHSDYRAKIKIIKDIAAAVVLLASLNAVAVGFVLFAKRIFH